MGSETHGRRTPMAPSFNPVSNLSFSFQTETEYRKGQETKFYKEMFSININLLKLGFHFLDSGVSSSSCHYWTPGF